jgi:hypothetical protein
MATAQTGPEQAQLAVTEVEHSLRMLKARKAELTDAITAIMKAVAKGQGGERVAMIATYQAEIDSCTRLISSRGVELKLKEADLRKQQLTAKREEFNDVLRQIETQKQNVIDHTRGASAGRIYELLKKARGLMIELGNAPMDGYGNVGPWPHDRNALKIAEQPVDPYRDWDVRFIQTEV